MAGFVHLHVHSEYSLLDGACRINGLVERVRALGQTAIAITDHGVMYGVVDFYKACKKAGIKPVIGCEVYVAARSRFDKTPEMDGERSHLVLLCENETGYRNLLKLVSAAYVEGFYTKPRVDRELLEEYHEGLIALSACLAGAIPRAFMRGDPDEALRTALWFDGVFGRGNYFLEIQDHSLPEQRSVNPQIIRLANETGIPLVCTNDAHYLTRDDAKMQQVLMCIQTNTTVDDPTKLAFDTDEFYIKSEEEMRALFPDISAAFDNTVRIAERCTVDFEFGKTQLPAFNAPGGDSVKYFREECRRGLHAYYGERPAPEIAARLDMEMDTIERMGYVDYYLIVNDFVQYAKSHDIPVGPGRGSGAGSLCAYCIGITGIDPIKYNLLFERFLNPERVSMPDFDIDFCQEKRQRVIDYVIDKYGADHVAQIVTFGTMAARAAIRDVARALGLPYATADQTAKMVPWELGMTLERAESLSAELRESMQADDQIRGLIDMAKRVEGMPRHASTHAAGVVITARPVSDYVPLCLNGDAVATQFPMGTLEELGLLKMDFLGLRNLTVIEDAVHMIRTQGGQPQFDIKAIPMNDKAVYDMLARGDTEGVFQFESAGMRRVLTGLGPTGFEDLIAVISLFRPGPMDSIPKYIHNRHHPADVRYAHPRLKPILDVTYGCIVYQEQVMQIFRELGGYSLGRADIVRRAMSKKKHDVMERERDIFINGQTAEDGTVEVEGCVRRGVPAKVAAAVFNDMSSFASYAFNKAHAAAYAMVAYQTAWLKCHCPREYMAALLTSVLDGSGKVAAYIAECGRMGIEVLPPTVNESDSGFTVSGENLRYGLLAVKNLGRGFIHELIAEREQNGPYDSYFGFCQRLATRREFNIRGLESLICCGALDGLGANRRQMCESAETTMALAAQIGRRRESGQLDLFDLPDGDDAPPAEPPLPAVEEFGYAELLAKEKEVTGLYMTGHPLAPWREAYAHPRIDRIDEMLTALEERSGDYKDGDEVTLIGMIGAVRKKTTKSDALMAYAGIEDLYGSIEMLVFPRVLTQSAELVRTGTIVLARGRISAREDEEPKLLADVFEAAPRPDELEGSLARVKSGGNDRNRQRPPASRQTQAPPPSPDSPKKKWLYMRASSRNGADYKRACLVTSVFEGDDNAAGPIPLLFRFRDTDEKWPAPANTAVALNEPMLIELRKILGDDSVAVIDI